jgi:hypothetical protein
MYPFLFNIFVGFGIDAPQLLYCPICTALLSEAAIDGDGNALWWKCISCDELFNLELLKTIMASA